MATITPSGLQFLFYGLDLRFQQAYRETPLIWPQIAERVPSNTAIQYYAWPDRIPKFREWFGERQVQNVIAQLQAVPNRKFELTIGIKREVIEDDQWGLYSNLAANLGYQAARIADDLIMAAVAAGTTALGFDGQPFFNANHPVDTSSATSAVQANLFALPLTAPNYQTVRQTMRGWVTRDNRPLGALSSGKVVLMVGPALELTARQLLQSQYIAPVTALGINAAAGMQTNVLMGTSELLVNPYITSATAWYLLDVGGPMKPFIFQERIPAQMVPKIADDTNNVFWRDEYIYGGRFRGAATYGPWFLAAQGNT
jgi:phage major head subunit gpT-like protein